MPEAGVVVAVKFVVPSSVVDEHVLGLRRLNVHGVLRLLDALRPLFALLDPSSLLAFRSGRKVGLPRTNPHRLPLALSSLLAPLLHASFPSPLNPPLMLNPIPTHPNPSPPSYPLNPRVGPVPEPEV